MVIQCHKMTIARIQVEVFALRQPGFAEGVFAFPRQTHDRASCCGFAQAWLGRDQGRWIADIKAADTAHHLARGDHVLGAKDLLQGLLGLLRDQGEDLREALCVPDGHPNAVEGTTCSQTEAVRGFPVAGVTAFVTFDTQ